MISDAALNVIVGYNSDQFKGCAHKPDKCKTASFQEKQTVSHKVSFGFFYSYIVLEYISGCVSVRRVHQ